MEAETPKIIIFEEDSAVRDYLRAFLKNYEVTRGYGIEAEPEPWNAKDQIDKRVALVMIGHSHSPEWNALSYLRDAPRGLVSIVGSSSWSDEDRMEFVRAGALFTYDRPCSKEGLEALVKTALKIGPFLVEGANKKGKPVVTIHLKGENDIASCLVVESYRN